MAIASSLAVIGGADPDDPLETENRVRHVVVGAVILLIATWALFATTLAFHSNLHAPWPVAALGGLLIAGVIACIDTLITVTPFKDERVRSKVYVIAARGALSLAMGLVISHATILFIYRDDLSRAVSETNNTDVTQITKDTVAKSTQTGIINSSNTAIGSDNTKIKDANQTLDKAKQQEQNRRAAWEVDTVCVNGRKAANGDTCGNGPESSKLYTDWVTYRDHDLVTAQSVRDTAVGAAQTDITKKNAAIATATTTRDAEVAHAIKDVKDSMGLQAQNNALWNILRHDWMAWLWPAFFIIVDLVVALLKGLLGESEFDRRRRLNRKLRDQLAVALTDPVPAGASPEFAGLLAYAAERQVEVERARIDRATRRRTAALSKPQRPASARGFVFGTAVVVVAVLVAGLLFYGPDGHTKRVADPSAPKVSTSASGILGAGVSMAASKMPAHPSARVSSVKAHYEDLEVLSSTYQLEPSGTLPAASKVTIPLTRAVDPGQTSVVVATSESAAGPWTLMRGTVTADRRHATFTTTHFSFFGALGASLSSLLTRFRKAFIDPLSGDVFASAERPSCPDESGARTDNYSITSDSGSAVYWCFGNDSGGRMLTVVNNRRYPLELQHPGLTPLSGNAIDGGSLAQVSRAISGSNSILAPESSITYRVSLPVGSQGGVSTSFDGVGESLYALQSGLEALVNIVDDGGAEAISKTAKFMEEALSGAGCIAGVIAHNVGSILANCLGPNNLFHWFGWKSVIVVPLMIFGPLIEFFRSEFDALGDQLNGRDKYGILIQHTQGSTGGGTSTQPGTGSTGTGSTGNQGAQPPVVTPPGATGPLTFIVAGTCTTASGTLTGQTAGFTPGGTFTVAARRPDGSAYPGLTTKGHVHADGSISWTWPCAGDPAGTYTTNVTDDATGRSSGWVSFVIAAVSSPPPPPVTAHQVTPYNNYGTANEPGIAMCRGNPGRPESVPGGTVAESFTVGAGVASIDSAVVQIDPANVTAHATLLVNGAAMATADSAAVGDTHFAFNRVSVKAGDVVTLSIQMTATDGKIITVYSAGSPPNSHLVVSNSCSDGAPNLNTTSTGLRATISGWSA